MDHGRRCSYDVTLWRVRLTIVEVETQQRLPCIVELHVAINNIQILSVAQQCFCGEFACRRLQQNVRRCSCKVPILFAMLTKFGISLQIVIKSSIPNFMAIRPPGAALIYANAPNNQMSGVECYILPSNFIHSVYCRVWRCNFIVPGVVPYAAL